MIKKLLLIAVVCTVFLSSCEKLNELTSFKLNTKTSFTIPGQQTGLGEILSIPRQEVSTSSEQTFENNNTRADLVEEAQLNKLSLTITSPANANFDFLNEVKIYIKAEGESEKLLAYKENIPEDGSQVLALETTGENLAPYIKKQQYSIRTDAVVDKVTDEDVDVEAAMTFRITAEVF